MLTAEALQSDLTVTESLMDGGGTGQADLMYINSSPLRQPDLQPGRRADDKHRWFMT